MATKFTLREGTLIHEEIRDDRLSHTKGVILSLHVIDCGLYVCNIDRPLGNNKYLRSEYPFYCQNMELRELLDCAHKAVIREASKSQRLSAN